MPAKKKKDRSVTAAVKPDSTSSPAAEPLFEVTFRGTEAAVRSALHNIRFAAPWDIGTARGIALDQTLVSGADLDDTLDGNKIRMYAQTDRDIYQQRCCNAAAACGHAVPATKQSEIAVDAGTTIRSVAQALYENAD
jgi:hypothetical protein